MYKLNVWGRILQVKRLQTKVHKKRRLKISLLLYINGISDYLMFGFSLFHSEIAGRTPIAITSSRRSHR